MDTEQLSHSGREADEEDEDESSRHAPSIDRRKALIAAALAVLLAGGAFTLLGQAAQLGRLRAAVDHSKKIWLAACLGAQVITYLGYMVGYRDAASSTGGPRFSFGTTARIVLFGAGMTILGASVGGLAVDYWALRRTGTRVHTATRRVLAVGTMEWTVMSLYACVAAALVLITDARVPLAMSVAWLCAVPLAVAGAVWFTSPGRVERFRDRTVPAPSHGRNRVTRAIGWVHNKAILALDDAISGVLLVRHLISHPIRYWGASVGYPIYWAGDMLTLYCAVRAFGVDVSVIPMILAYTTSNVISSLPLPAGGAGGIDAAMVLALRVIGIPLASAVLAVFVFRMFTFWLPIIPALLLLPGMRRLHRELRHVQHTQRDPDIGVPFRPPEERET